MSDDKNQTSEPKQRPADTLRDGPLKATIWERNTETGSMFNTKLSRSYQDKEGNFKETDSFRSRDMLAVGELSRAAHSRISELKQQRAAARKEAAQAKDQGQER